MYPYFQFWITDDGDMMGSGGAPLEKCAYLGKVADTFDSYPYSIKVMFTNIKYAKSIADAGTITFHSATEFSFDSLSAVFDGDIRNDYYRKNTYIKRSDKFLYWTGKEVSSKQELWKTFWLIN